MLCSEYRMATPRRLFSVIFGLGGSKAFGDEVIGMFTNGVDTSVMQISKVLITQLLLP